MLGDSVPTKFSLLGELYFFEGEYGLREQSWADFLLMLIFIASDARLTESRQVTDLLPASYFSGGLAETLVEDLADFRTGVCAELIEMQLGRILKVSLLSFSFC